jgi:medium-chain acyl-[acyl-carrier-protein] hydrolase
LSTSVDRWFWIPCPRPRAALRLYCFAHAGAGASAFALWASAAPSAIEIAAIQLPGRETRLSEPPLDSFAPAATSIAELLAAPDGIPFAFFGHSAGALLAVRVASLVLERRLPLVHLFASGASCNPPADAIYRLHGAAFLRGVSDRYGALPLELTADTKIWTIFERVLRADLKALESDVLQARPLALPITVVSGSRDEVVDSDALHLWQSWSGGKVCFEVVDADHYSYRREPALYFSVIMRHLVGSMPHDGGSSVRLTNEPYPGRVK